MKTQNPSIHKSNRVKAIRCVSPGWRTSGVGSGAAIMAYLAFCKQLRICDKASIASMLSVCHV